jgi:hypothetical protein
MVIPLVIVAYLPLKHIYFGFQYSLKFKKIVMTKEHYFSLKQSSVQQGVQSAGCVQIQLVIIFVSSVLQRFKSWHIK